ncbi:hypothetical protein THIOSC15_750001 [uncultured Thiomicrorhabdus sp.]
MESPKFLLVGDSHANSAYKLSFRDEIPKEITKSYALAACPTLFGVKKIDGRACSVFNDWVFNKIKTEYLGTPVIVFNRTSAYLKGSLTEKVANRPQVFFTKEYTNSEDHEFIKEFVDSIVSSSCLLNEFSNVYLVRPLPEFRYSIPIKVARDKLLTGYADDIKITREEYMSRNKVVWDAQNRAAEQCGVKILDPTKYLCDGKYCYASKNEVPFYNDDNHLNQYGSDLIKPMFNELLGELE